MGKSKLYPFSQCYKKPSRIDTLVTIINRFLWVLWDKKPSKGDTFINKFIWRLWDFSGARYVWYKVRPLGEKKPSDYKPPSTFFLWLIGIYVAFFGLASARYENRVDIIENRANAIFAQLATPIKIRALSRIPRIQNMECPRKPEILKPNTVLLSLLFDDLYHQMVENLKETLEDWSDHLSDISLMRVNLEGADLKRANLQNTDLSQAIMVRANLQGANLNKAWIVSTNFQGADLQEANLQNVFQRGANFQDANLKKAQLEDADLTGVNFQNAKLLLANLAKAEMHSVDLRNASLVKANLEGADLERANLQDTYLLGANFQNANLKNANFQDAYLLKNIFHDAYLKRDYLGRASLKDICSIGTVFQNADLQNVNLQGAYLLGANFQNTNLKNVNFKDSKLLAANLRKAKNLSPIQLSKSKSLYKAQMDPDLEMQMLVYPKLFKFEENIVFFDKLGIKKSPWNWLLMISEPQSDLERGLIFGNTDHMSH